MARMGVAVIKTRAPIASAKTLILDGIATADRPAAVGYFVLTTLRELYFKYRFFPTIELSFGESDAAALMSSKDPVQTLPLDGDWFGKLYELVLSVERNERDTDPGPGSGDL